MTPPDWPPPDGGISLLAQNFGAHYFDPESNITYFGHNIDVRLAPKCGCKTLNKMYWRAHKLELMNEIFPDYQTIEPSSTAGWWHLMAVRTHGDYLNLPFRKNSIRYAIKRNPVERFLSAVEYVAQNYYDSENRKYKFQPYGSNVINLKMYSLSSILEMIIKRRHQDIHYAPMYYFYGDKKQYDYVFDLSELRDLIQEIMNECGIRDPSIVEQFVSMHENKTQNRIFPSIKQLTKTQLRTIEKLVSIDFENGWC